MGGTSEEKGRRGQNGACEEGRSKGYLENLYFIANYNISTEILTY